MVSYWPDQKLYHGLDLLNRHLLAKQSLEVVINVDESHPNLVGHKCPLQADIVERMKGYGWTVRRN
jgi:hypothetical protein